MNKYDQTETTSSDHPIKPYWLESFYSLLGIFIGMGIICYVSIRYDMSLLIPSYASSALMLFVSYKNPFAQPRNVIGGHFMSALAGVITSHLFINDWWSMTIAIVLAAFFMIISKTLHPPGGATALVAHLGGYVHGAGSTLFPVLFNSVIIILVAYIVNNKIASRKYPTFWW
jgi:CBS-domain-containing membrane protein